MLLNDVIQRKEMIQAIKTPDEEGQKTSREEIRERKAAKEEVVDEYTRKDKRTVRTRQLIDSACGRMKRAVPYASLAVSKGASRRVITVPTEVAKALVEKFDVGWAMGENHGIEGCR